MKNLVRHKDDFTAELLVTVTGDVLTVTFGNPAELLERDFLVAFYTKCWPGEHEEDPDPEAIADSTTTLACWGRAAERLQRTEALTYRLTHRRTRREKTLHLSRR